MRKYLLGIDRGTTNIKAAVYDLNGNEIRVRSNACEKIKSPVAGAAEQDMNRMWDDAAVTIRSLWDEVIRPQDILAVGMSGQGGGLFLVDKDGYPVRPGIVSLDNRISGMAAAWKKEKSHQEFIEAWEPERVPNSTEALLYWVKECEPDNYKKIHWILQSKDWIRFKLTGEAYCDPSEASNQFILDECGRYSLEHFAKYGLDEMVEKFPPLCNPWEIAGYVTEEAQSATGLLAGTPVAAGGHDVAMVALGTGCYKDGDLTTVMGTFGLNLLITEKPVDEVKHIAKTVLAGSKDGYLMMNGGSTGVITEWFLDRFCDAEVQRAEREKVNVFSLVEDAVLKEQDEGRSLVICHPFLEPPYTLPGYEKSQFGLYGINLGTTKAQIIRAFYEGIALEMALSIEELKRTGSDIVRMKLIGGGAASRLWGQMFADAADICVEVPDIKEAGCRGAAMSAGIAVGLYRDHEELASIGCPMKRAYHPDVDGRSYMRNKKAIFNQIALSMGKYWNN